MSCHNILPVFACKQPYTLVVEPWAEEFPIHGGEKCRVVARHPDVTPMFEVAVEGDRLIVWVNTGGATYEFWRGDHCEFSTPIPIPGSPHFS